MARQDLFIPDETYQLQPVTEGDRAYGYEITGLYGVSMDSVMRGLFAYGLSGMICGETKPKSVEFIHRLLASQEFCRPEDQKENGLFALSDGYHISARFDARFYISSLRWHKQIRFQGDYEALLGADYPNEDTGTMAVCLAGNMALRGILPLKRNDGIMVREMKIASMHADEFHIQPWLAVEFDVYVHNHMFSVLDLPRDLKTGYVPLDSLKKLAEVE